MSIINYTISSNIFTYIFNGFSTFKCLYSIPDLNQNINLLATMPTGHIQYFQLGVVAILKPISYPSLTVQEAKEKSTTAPSRPSDYTGDISIIDSTIVSN